MFEASFYIELGNGKVKCMLCPHECIISEGKYGICKTRLNKKGKLFTNIYNKVAAIHFDPVEKKPFYHFYPGKIILSIGGTGCNFNCDFCQNHSISQCHPEEYRNYAYLTAKQIINHALKDKNNIGISYTYNEPLTFFEFMFECSKDAHKTGLKNSVVSNGFVNPIPLKKIIPFIDAFNIDLKSFNEHFYKKYTGGRLSTILENMKTIKESGIHLEITNLVITNLNDDEKEYKKMVNWIAHELGKDVPLHISRYFPAYKMSLDPTPTSKMNTLYSIAKNHLDYVYFGNVFNTDKNNTYCPKCHNLLIERNYGIFKIHGLKNKKCDKCSFSINIIN